LYKSRKNIMMSGSSSEKNSEEKIFGEFRRKVQTAEILSAAAPQVDIVAVRQGATNLISAKPNMVRAAIETCKKGHYQAMKFLFDGASIFPVSETPENEEQPGLPEMVEEAEVTNVCDEAEPTAEHTVE